MAIRLLITDLDNTLYDWVTFFAHAFEAMAGRLVEILGVEEEALLDEFQALHQSYGTSEQPFTALDLPCVRREFGDLPRRQLIEKLDPAFHAFNVERKKHLRLYDSVAATLEELRRRGVRVVGHTESIAANAVYRLQMLGIAHHFEHLYVLDSDYPGHPDPERADALRPPPGLVRKVPRRERKPNPELLRGDICRREGVEPRQACYVGDSLTRDIGMAKSAGLMAVWARYGTRYDRRLWDILVRVTHWSAEDVAREEELRRRYDRIEPDFTIDRFGEILSLPGIAAEKASRAAAVATAP